MVPQAQSLDACNPSDLQDNKPLTAKRMRWDCGDRERALFPV
jgi:hypothetical protein